MRAGERLAGTFLNLGSPLAAEICGLAGFDWVVIDLEHGAGTEAALVGHLQALAHTGATPLIRVEANERARVTRALDAGAAGVVFPRLDGGADARLAVSHLRYPPAGLRGVATMNRGVGFGARLTETLADANHSVVCVVQIESEAAVADARAIAAEDGVDVLFVGPSDLSQAMGIFGRTSEPRFVAAVDAVAEAAREFGKATGVLVRDAETLAPYVERGFQLLGVGSDGLFLSSGAAAACAAIRSA